MCFGSSPGWNDGIGNIGIFSNFSLNFNLLSKPPKKESIEVFTSSY